MTTANALLNAIAEGREQNAWEAAQRLAKVVLEMPLVVLAKAVLDGGPFALRRAAELGELVVESERETRALSRESVS